MGIFLILVIKLLYKFKTIDFDLKILTYKQINKKIIKINNFFI
jgi:hypothetical protein